MNQPTEACVSPQPRVCDLSSALQRMGANVQLVREMLALFREDAPVYQSRLQDAVTEGNAAGVEHAAHSLKGMLSMFGAEAAMQVAQRLERMGNKGDLIAAPAQAGELETEIARFLDTFTAELAKF